jgi:hypothetical protein
MNSTSGAASSTAPTPAAAPVARVRRRAHRRSRVALDRMVVDTVPVYAAAVDDELRRFDEAAVASRRKMDGRYQAAWSTSTIADGLHAALAWVCVFSFAASFALVFPGGGRTGVSVPLGWVPTMHAWSAIFLSLSVAAQLGRQAPYRHHVPPRDVLAWAPVGFGVPSAIWMFWRHQLGVPTPPWALILIVLAVVVGGCTSVIRLAKRRRDPKLTKKVDAAARGRVRALRKNLLTQADVSARRIEAAFEALPEPDRRRLESELRTAVAAGQPRGTDAATPPNRPGTRGVFPGWLLLSHRVSESGNRLNGRAEWFVGDHIDERVSR